MLKPISIKEAEEFLSEIDFITNQDQLSLEYFEELQFKLSSFDSDHESHPEIYQDRETWLKVGNAYKLATYLVMLKVSELLERKAA